MATSGPFLPTIQVLRAVAALAVVLYHVESGINGWFAPRVQLPSMALGAAGVDLFFLISGFIMVVTSRRLGAREFLVRRLARIVPLYWLSTLVFLAAALVVPAREGQDHSLPAILASFLFLPYARPDGVIQPLNPVGWTLNYEMLFYVVFAAALALSPRRIVPAVVGALALAVLGGWAFAPEETALRFWTHPLLLEFAAGMIVGSLFLAGHRIGAGPAILLAVAAVVAVAVLSARGEPLGWGRLAAWGGPSLLLLVAAALGPSPAVPRFVTRLGDASYSLYLLHLPILLALKQVGPRLGLPWDIAATPWLVALAVTAAAVALSLATYEWFERPLTAALRRRLGDRPATAEPAARAGAA